MSLRGAPLERPVTLPDGRSLVVRVGVPDDSYVAGSELDEVGVELLEDDRGVAFVLTLLAAEQADEAQLLLDELASKLETGSLEPTAAAIEHVVDRARGS